MILLDLFCGAGGAAMGYHNAGFSRIVGVDRRPQPRYPFEFIQYDAMQVVSELAECGSWTGIAPDAIHMSPPCQGYSVTANIHANAKFVRGYPKYVEQLQQWMDYMTFKYGGSMPIVMENVVGAPLRDPIKVCGLAFPELNVKRHRLFECNWPAIGTHCGDHKKDYVMVFGNSVQRRVKYHGKNRELRKADGEAAMGIDWMTKREMSESIPPSYTQFIGYQLIQHIERQRLIG